MQPRYSILALLTLTAYIAVLSAGIANRSLLWVFVALYLTLIAGPFLVLDVLMERRAKAKRRE